MLYAYTTVTYTKPTCYVISLYNFLTINTGKTQFLVNLS